MPFWIVASALVHLPAVVWHRYRAPDRTSIMMHRAREAAAEDVEWNPRYEWVSLEAVPQHLERAVLIGEDSRFYDHDGFDYEEIRSAWERWRRGGRLRGASTITQQAARSLYLSPSRNVFRKLREAVITVEMEAILSKDRILELYLNVAELGPGVFGVEAASQSYFGQPVSKVTRQQAALLAATLPAPRTANPARPTRGLRYRQARILDRMERWDRPPQRPTEKQPRQPIRRPAESIEWPSEAP
ncbi:MAG: monofunctional biosynthetic peptidoglycan transglycosylase [Gemmatimonadota bacterium]